MKAAAEGRPGASWSGPAPAKVNLRLKILAREPSGYHQLETVFQALELADTLHLTLRPDSEVTLEISGVPRGTLGPTDTNLAVRAARRLLRALRERGGDPPGVSIHLEKRIPAAAGLGGGSSDAAAVLLGLNALAGAPLTVEVLMQMGAALGSDVPFFILKAARALGRGRGERLVVLPALPVRPTLLAVPSPGVSTAWAFEIASALRDSNGEDVPESALLEPLAERDWEAVTRAAVNDFEEALFPRRPDIRALKEAFTEAGASPALLSGSGSSVFGVFRDSEALERGARSAEAAIPGVPLIRTYTQG